MPLVLNLARTTKKSAQILSCALALTLILSTTGCIPRIWKNDDDAARRIQNAPLIMLDQADQHHLIVMQAPSPGWSIRLDATHSTPKGKDVLVTIRRPDPAYQYTQQIVLMRTLTTVRLNTDIQIVARMLDHDEKSKNKGYAPVTLVESFE